MATPKITVRVETEVEMDIDMMANAFAHMHSDEQARFLALAYQKMGTYELEQPDGTMKEQGSMGREMQMAYIGHEFDREPDARAFIRDFYQMTCEQVEEPMHATNWDAPTIDDIRKAKEQIASDVGLKPQYVMSAETKRAIPLHSISESIVVSEGIECHCIQPVGVWYEIGDRVLVHRTRQDEDRWGTVVHVWADGRPDVLLDSELPQPKEQVGDMVRRIRGGSHTTYITVKADGLDFEGNAVYIKGGSGVPGAYVGSVTAKHDDGTVTIRIDPGPLPYDPDRKLPSGVVTKVNRHVKEGELLTADDLMTADDPVSPVVEGSVMPIACDECKGTGKWINPFNDEETPCSKGCKP
jgi:hypothetical protein